MPGIERLTITMPTEMAAIVKQAVESGDYASASEIVREALREWRVKWAMRLQELASLKSDVEHGVANPVAGQVQVFDASKLAEQGRFVSRASRYAR